MISLRKSVKVRHKYGFTFGAPIGCLACPGPSSAPLGTPYIPRVHEMDSNTQFWPLSGYGVTLSRFCDPSINFFRNIFRGKFYRGMDASFGPSGTSPIAPQTKWRIFASIGAESRGAGGRGGGGRGRIITFPLPPSDYPHLPLNTFQEYIYIY